jgi:hypothetical protein
MSRRALIVALVAVSLALAVTVGVLVGMSLNRRTSTAGASVTPSVSSGSSNGDTSPLGSTGSAPSSQLTESDLGLVSVNAGCEYLDSVGVYWVSAIAVHGVDVGATKADALTDADRAMIQEVHRSLAAATVHDQRWAPLQSLVTRDEVTAITRWDQGGVSAHDAVLQTVGKDEDTVHGECAAARDELKSAAQARNLSPQEMLQHGGATDRQVQNWILWSD